MLQPLITQLRHRRNIARLLVSVAIFLLLFPALRTPAAPLGEQPGSIARMLVDARLSSASSQMSGLTTVGEFVYFLQSEQSGVVLWRSDGTETGTAPIRKVRNGSGVGGGVVESLAVGNVLYFIIDDGTQAQSLWRSDGTATGTYALREVYPDAARWQGVSGLIAFRGRLIFVAMSEAGLAELWKTDGTGVATGRIVDIRPYDGYAVTTKMAVVEDILYFIVRRAPMGHQLWRTDGTEAGSVRVRDFTQVSVHLTVTGLVSHEGALYMSMAGSTQAIWRSDGTEAGTTSVVDLGVITGGLPPYQLASLQGRLYFVSSYGIYSPEATWKLWQSDGTQQGTIPLASGKSDSPALLPSALVVVGSRFFFKAGDAAGTLALWRSDGTPAGSEPVQAIGPLSAYLDSIAVQGEQLLFTATTVMHGRELWTIGPSGPAVLLRDILPGPASSGPDMLVTLAGHTLFTADDGVHGRELWMSDGTLEGTSLALDLTTSTLGSNPEALVVAGAQLFYTADDGVHGRELWKSDGTPEGTGILVDINPGTASSSPGDLTVAGGKLFFTADDGVHGRELWTSDGTPERTQLLAELTVGPTGSGLQILSTVLGDQVFFLLRTVGDFGYASYALWKSDGTPDGTMLVKSIWPKQINGAAVYRGNLILSVSDVYSGPYRNSELWSSDGTPEGTGSYYIGPVTDAWSGMAPTRDGVYLTSGGRSMTGPLWRSDGMTAGTNLVRHYATAVQLTGAADLPDAALIRLDGDGARLVRVADGVIGEEILLSTGEGEHLWTPPPPQWLIPASGKVYLNVAEEISGAELWRSDGTAAATRLVRDICPGQAGSYPGGALALGGKLLFAADNCVAGTELWLSDGSADGTYLLQDIHPGTPGSQPGPIVRLGDRALFAADDGTHGRELWALSIGTMAAYQAYLPVVR